MAASIDGCSFRFDLPWPLHRALATLSDRATACRLADGLPSGLIITGLPEAGRGVDGLEYVLLQLAGEGCFVPSPFDGGLLVVNPDAAPRLRRTLLGEDARLVRLIHRAALLWATDCSTCEKNLATARASWAFTVASGTPNRLQRPAAVL
jgi:hypothetical protein